MYYIGSEDDRTAISLKDLGPGPFKYAKGTVTHYDKHSHVLTIRDAHDQTETFSVSGQAVVDTGMGPKNGEAVMREVAKVSKNTEIYLVTTHFHAEHVAGISAFPAKTKYVISKMQQQDLDEKRSHQGRSR